MEPSLRDRKKLQAKAAIQVAALKLFADRGYEQTTTQQIAEMAQVSPSTLFRYFATKEAIPMYDSLDPIIMKAFAAQPAELSIISALRRSIQEVYGALTPSQLGLEMQRFKLLRTIPQLRAHMLDEMARSIDLFAELIARRSGKDEDDIQVRNLAGAIIGVGMAALLVAYKRPDTQNSITTFDFALADLERGLLT